MHVAWSIIAGALLISAFRGRMWAWILGAAHPCIMGIAVIVTANHYLLDIVVGVLALIGALIIMRAMTALSTHRAARGIASV
jgi:hypothetical protein